MNRNNALALVGASVVALFASTAQARPPEAGDWDPRFSPPVLVTDRPSNLNAKFDWWTASFSERKQFLQRYNVPPRIAAIAATGGMPLSHVDGDGRGAFLTPRALGGTLMIRW